MVTIRELVACLETSGLHPEGFKWPKGISVLKDFFGHTIRPSAGPLSMLQQIRRIKQKHFHLNLIRVGSEPMQDKEQLINNALYHLREIYATVALGVGRVRHRYIPVDEAKGYDIIECDAEAEDLTNEWTVSNDGLDIFIVLHRWWETGEGWHAGKATEDGPCNKNNSFFYTGCVVSLRGTGKRTSYILGHEIGHYLGLPHIYDLESDDVDEPDEIADLPSDAKSNMMFPRANGSKLKWWQGVEMKKHCFVHSGCRIT